MRNRFCPVLGPKGKCGAPTTQVHHRLRRGKNLLEVSTWLACCADCHERIERNGRWARRMAYTWNPASIQPLPPISDVFLPYDD